MRIRILPMSVSISLRFDIEGNCCELVIHADMKKICAEAFDLQRMGYQMKFGTKSVLALG